MNHGTEHGHLILADISGYTSYLAGVELTHAQDILAELLELIVQRFDPPLSIAKLEGDAVFAYAPQESLPRIVQIKSRRMKVEQQYDTLVQLIAEEAE